MKVAFVAFLSVLLVSATGCGGGGGDRTISKGGYTFTYPSEWRELDVGGSAIPEPASSTYVGPKPFKGADLVAVSARQNGGPMPKTTADLHFLGRGFAGLYAQSRRVTKGPTFTTVLGHLAIRLETQGANPEGTTTGARLLWVFSDTTEYKIECQFTSEGRAEIARGCAQIEKSLQVK